MTLVRVEYSLPKFLLVKSLLHGAGHIASTNIGFNRITLNVAETREASLIYGDRECERLRTISDDENWIFRFVSTFDDAMEVDEWQPAPHRLSEAGVVRMIRIDSPISVAQ